MRTLALFAALGLWLTGCGDDPRPPNVVIIAIDTLRPDHLGCYGYERATSPNIDAWAQDAVVFDEAQTAAPWTAPSLISLMTSLQPSVHGVAGFPEPGRMNERVETLARQLKDLGYRTGAFTDGGYAKGQFGLDQGFDVYPPPEGEELLTHASNLAHPTRLRPNVDRTLEWLRTVEARPFFLFFHTYEVHGPYAPPAGDIQRFRPGYDDAAEHARLQAVIERWLAKREIDADGVRLILAHSEHCGAGNGPEKEGLPAKMRELGVGSLDAERMQFWRDLYDAEILHTDRELKRLLDFLARPELRQDTIVVFVSDHGEGFGEHGMTGHGNVLHEENLRVLLALRAPGVAARRVPDVVRTIDVMPTVLELVGARNEPLALQGRSLVPLLRGESLPSEPSFSHALSRKEHEGRLWSVRDGRWRYVWNDETSSGQLFDLESDPGESGDVAGANPKITERMLGLLRAQRDLDASFRERASGPVQDYQLDAETLAHLKELGYVGDEATEAVLERSELPVPRLGDAK